MGRPLPRALIDRAVTAMACPSDAKERAQASIGENIKLMRRCLEQEAGIRSPKETQADLLALAAAARTLAKAPPAAAHMMMAHAIVRGLSLPPVKLAGLADDLEWAASAIVLPKGARRAPTAKSYAVLATANVFRDTLPELANSRHDRLVRAVGPKQFRDLAEIMYEGIAGAAEGVGQLDRQIRAYRLDQLNFDQGQNITLRGLKLVSAKRT